MPESSAANNASPKIIVGQIVGVFGIKGWVKIKSFTEPMENVLRYSPWELRLPTGIKSFQVVEYAQRPQGIAVKLKGVDDRDQALALGKAQIQVERAQLAQLEAGEFYWSQLIGLRVVSQFDGAEIDLGRVQNLLETGSNDVLVVRGDERARDLQERLIPYLPGQFVLDVSLELGVIRVDWDPDF
jgi:16S rRNA processing protein RimM